MATKPKKQVRHFSKAARASISRAQKARWRAWRAAKAAKAAKCANKKWAKRKTKGDLFALDYWVTLASKKKSTGKKGKGRGY